MMSEFLIPKSMPKLNIVIKLQKREISVLHKPNTYIYCIRNLYQNIYPNFTITSVEKPPCYPRKFSLDGKYFLAFSQDQTSVEIYLYRGSAAAADLLEDCCGDYISVSGNSVKAKSIRNKIFTTFFKLKHSVIVTSNGEHLNRECSLFTDDNKYVIVGSAVYVEDPHPPFYHVGKNNEALEPNSRIPLEDYTLYIINMEEGVVTDRKLLNADKIFLSHNQGLYLYKNILAVLSVQHQFIHVFQVSESGQFVHLRTIGRFCYNDDELYLFSVGDESAGPVWSVVPYLDTSINSLKHRFLVFLFLRALEITKQTGSPYELRKFYQYFDHLRALRMWKMQLLDEDHLLVKYASKEVVAFRASEPNSQPLFFAVYNMKTTRIIAVYENTSEELVQLCEKYCEFFRNSRIGWEMQFTSSPSNNIHAKQTGLLKFKIYPGIIGQNPPSAVRKVVAFMFHPSDPFVISVQRTNFEYIVNIHVRHEQEFFS